MRPERGPVPILGPTAPRWQSPVRPGVSHSVPRPLPTWREGWSAHHSDNLTSGPFPHFPASLQAGFWLHILSEGPGQCTLGKTKRRKSENQTLEKKCVSNKLGLSPLVKHYIPVPREQRGSALPLRAVNFAGAGLGLALSGGHRWASVLGGFWIPGLGGGHVTFSLGWLGPRAGQRAFWGSVRVASETFLAARPLSCLGALMGWRCL